MKKLMIAIAGAVALGASAYADTTWFNGGIATGWTNATSMAGGTWSGANDADVWDLVEDSTTPVSDGKLGVDASEELQFNATDMKTLLPESGASSETVGNVASATFTVGATFTPFTSVPSAPEATKAGIILCTNSTDGVNYFYVLKFDAASLDADIPSNIWVKTTKTGTSSGHYSITVTLGQQDSDYCSTISYSLDGQPLDSGRVYVKDTDGELATFAVKGSGKISNLSATYVPVVEFTVADAGSGIESYLVSNITTGVELGTDCGNYAGKAGDQIKVYYFAAEGKFVKGENPYVFSGTFGTETQTDVTSADVKDGEAYNQDTRTYYATLAQALTAAGSDETVVLQTSVTLTAAVTVPAGVTLDLYENAVAGVEYVTNNGIIKIYNDDTGTAFANIPGKYVAGEAIEKKDDNENVLLSLPANTEYTLKVDVIGSNNRPTISIIAPDSGEVTWNQEVGPYKQIFVGGDTITANFGGALAAGQSADLTTIVSITGTVTLASNVTINDYAKFEVVGTLTKGDFDIVAADSDHKIVHTGNVFTSKAISWSTLTISNCDNCTIVVKDGDDEVTTGEKFDIDEEKQLTVTRTPYAGYELVGYEASETITMNQATVTVTSAVKAKAPTKITISGATSVDVGKTITLDLTFEPSDLLDSQKGVTWTSSDDNKAIVSAAGVVTGVAAGTVTITATSTVATEIEGTFEVTVNSTGVAITWNTDGNCVVTNAGVEVASGTSFAQGAQLVFYPTVGTITNVSVGTVATPYTYTVGDTAANITVYAGKSAGGSEIDIPAGKTVQDINNNKSAYLSAPGGEKNTTQTYLDSFTAVATGDGKAEFVLNSDGTNTVLNAGKTASSTVLDAVLTTGSGDVEIANPEKGFYYSFKQDTGISSWGTKEYGTKNLLGGVDTIKFTVEKSGNAHFYQIVVTPNKVD